MVSLLEEVKNNCFIEILFELINTGNFSNTLLLANKRDIYFKPILLKAISKIG